MEQWSSLSGCRISGSEVQGQSIPLGSLHNDCRMCPDITTPILRMEARILGFGGSATLGCDAGVDRMRLKSFGLKVLEP